MLEPCDSWNTLMMIQFLMNFQLTWLFNFLCASIGIHFTLHWVITEMTHSGDVAKTTYDTTRHDTADMYWLVVVFDTVDMYWLAVVFVSSCCDTEWCMYSWCALSSPLHGIVLRGLRWSWYCMMVRCICSFSLLLDVLGMSVQLQASLLACAVFLHPICHLAMV